MRLRPRRIARALAQGVAYLALALIVIGAVSLLALESGWGKNQVRALIVSQASRILTGTLEIDRVEGSLFQSVQLEGVRLVQDGTPVVTIESASLAYSIREVVPVGHRDSQPEPARPACRRRPSGRRALESWQSVRPRPPHAPPGQRPARLITFERVEIVDGTVEFQTPLTLGAAHVPSRLEHLEGAFAFELQAPAWNLSIEHMAWRGASPN